MQDSQVFAEWKRFTHGLPTEGAVRSVILDSWTRCLRAGVTAEPAHVTLRRVGEADLRQRLEENRELIEITQRHVCVISSFLEPLAHVMYLVDREGIVLYAQGSDPDSMQDLGLLPGYDWSEHTMGTNGAGTALATGQPITVIMSEHFIRHFHDSTCIAAPIHDENGAVIAAIDVCTARENAIGECLTSVARLASVIEQELSSVRRREELVRRLQDRCAQLETEKTDRSRTSPTLREDALGFRELIDMLSVAVYVCDVRGVILHYNRCAAQLWGREPRCGDPGERFCGAHRLYLSDGAPLPHEQAPLAQVLCTGLSQGNRQVILERPDGSRRMVLVNPVPLRNKAGEVSGVVNCMLDITDHKQTEEALRNQDSRLAQIFRNVRVALYEAELVEPFCRIWVSDNIESLSGFPPRRFIEDSKYWASRLHPDDRDRVFDAFATLVDRGSLSCEYRWQCADGTYRWFLDQAVRQHNANGPAPVILGTWQDMTEGREAHDQLQQSLKQLRMLSRHLEVVKEEEQTRLAREIHDEMGVLMTGLKLDLAQMRDLLGGADLRTTAASLQSKIASMDETLDQTITVVQRIAADLRPSVLDDLGLVAAIEWQAKAFRSRTGICCDVIIETDDPLIDSERATALFRICQEALTNVARHAHATCVTIRLGETLDQVLLEIEDDGEGVPTEKLTDRMSIGLLGMRERAELLEGEVHITGRPGNGTIITVRMPATHAQREMETETL